LFCKGGAEGYQVIGVLPGVLSEDAPGLGIAIKVSDGDGSGRARESVSLTLLATLGVLDAAELAALADYGNKPLKNWRGFEIGEIRPAFSLH
jgi:L-asparaginase II